MQVKAFLNSITKALFEAPLFFFIVFSISSGCGGNKNNKADEKFSNAKILSDIVSVSNKKPEFTVDLSNSKENFIKLSSLITDYSFLRLNDEKHFIGEVSKVIFSDSLILIADFYITNNLIGFDRKNGDFLFEIAATGEGPQEFSSLYDFDYDFQKNEILIFDGKLAKCLYYDTRGRFKKYAKLPFRIGNVRKAFGHYFNYPQQTPNYHLGNIALSDILVANNDWEVVGGALEYEEEATRNDYYASSFFHKNGELTFFPRFSETIYSIQKSNDSIFLDSLSFFDLGGFALKKNESNINSEDFFADRNLDKKWYGMGGHFINENWIGVQFETWRRIAVTCFIDRRTGQYYAGNNFTNDIEGMPIYGFPESTYGNEGLIIIPPDLTELYKNITPEQKQMLLSSNNWSEEFKSLADEVDDVESMILMFFTFQ